MLKTQEFKICEYCQTVNRVDMSSCIACGAPLPKVKINNQHPVSDHEKNKTIKADPIKDEKVRKAIKKTDDLYHQAFGIYSVFWRTIGEVFSIAIISFGLGVVGGATQMGMWGVVLGGLYGFFVGLILKRYLWLVISAPIGLIVGALIGGLLWAIGAGSGLMVFFLFFGALIFTIMGAKFLRYRQKNLYEKARPLLGAIGGLFFSTIGLLFGYGAAALIG